MRRQQRLRKRKDFQAVYRKGRASANKLVALRVLRTQLPYTRYGFSVGKALGNAVVRNRVRRRLREGVRSLLARSGWDIVISARRPAAGADYHELREAVTELLSRARILDQDAPGEGRGGEERRPKP
jgi:ribonuclease P protein component